MKRLLLGLSIVIGAWMLSPTPDVQARGGSNKGHKTYKGHKSSVGVPELDPSAAGSALVLLLGGVAYVTSRRREDDLAY
jgi:hypothetical protein